ncbi:hypothetical protein TSAR_007497 [Trichomalopsis sarcophagae]|uniref:Protein cueball n=1 Tax=Trichomalopsis sarcophagae TaxID=543379 RepID=A0A232FEX6_9HYME|nr:hypothetical protein TSAR_007497 [Trichomalopsis sarcophagae]
MFDRTMLMTMLGVLLLIGCTTTVTARTWDLAVTHEKEIDFIARNGSLIGNTVIADAYNLVGSAYDDDSYTMFLSDADNPNYSIFSVDLTAKNVTAKPILKRDSPFQIPSMAYDSQTRTLFWTNQKEIMKMHVPPNGALGKPQTLHKLDDKNPIGIALDVCNRHIYWVNSKQLYSSIMRSNLDGSNLTTIVSENLYDPTTIIVDHVNSKLYWIDDEEGIHYKLEESNLDGSERVTLVHGKHQQPIHLVVDRESIYWTDFTYRAVWKFNKDTKPGDIPVTFKSYYDRKAVSPRSILARDNLGNGIDCKAMKAEVLKKMSTTLAAPKPTLQSFNNLTTSREESDEAEKCFNGGLFVKLNGSCKCKPGYSGSRCEISSCHNYCLRGECSVNDKGAPVCKCGSAYDGLRCEHDVCNGYCLNDGRCTVDDMGKPNCECKYSSGARCEVTFDMTEICGLYCMNRQFQMTSINTSSCRCAELNQTIEEVLGYDTFNCTILVPILAGFVGMLTIVVIFLSVYISKLRRRPRIKKRFLVNKGGITPLTSRPGASLPADQCEITIENCCNMNICETPCFEPKLRNATSTRSNGKKKEEKNGLLDHMEDGGNSC